MQEIRVRDEEVYRFLGRTDANILHSVEAMMKPISKATDMWTKTLEEESHMKLLKWLSLTPHARHHEEISERRTPNFGGWLLRHANYVDWYNSSSSSTLLLHGITGSGKTHLCSVIIDSILTAARAQASAAPFAYFYCLDIESEPERASPDEVLRSILRQLTVNGIRPFTVRDSLMSEYQRRLAKARVMAMDLPKLKPKECVGLILKQADNEPLTIVVDAVDEIRERDRHVLLQALNDIVTKASNVVKVFVTSRNSSHILDALQSSKRISITSDETHTDMEAFIREKIDNAVSQRRLLDGNVSLDFKRELLDTLLHGVGEM